MDVSATTFLSDDRQMHPSIIDSQWQENCLPVVVGTLQQNK